jgi:hypothetical protein
LTHIASEKNYPDRITLEYLSSRIWIAPSEVDVQLHCPAKYEIQAPEMKRLVEQGASISTIASLYHTSSKDVLAILRFAETGEIPFKKTAAQKEAKGRGAGSGKGIKKAERFKQVVANLRDSERKPWPTIREHIKEQFGETLSLPTVVRSYDLAHPELIKDAAERGEHPNRGHAQRLSSQARKTIRRLLLKRKYTQEQIAKKAGCSVRRVAWEARRMRDEGLIPVAKPGPPTRKTEKLAGR